MKSTTIQRIVRLFLSFALAVPFVLHAIGAVSLPALDQAENIAYDIRLNLTLPEPPAQGEVRDDRIVIVDIDSKSLAVMGQWPWPRDDLATIVDRLFEKYNIKALGFDIVFAEASVGVTLRRLQALAAGPLSDVPEFSETVEELQPELDNDRVFARSLEDRNIVTGFLFHSTANRAEAQSASVAAKRANNRVGALPEPIHHVGGNLAGTGIKQPQGYTGNLARIRDASRGGGFFDNPLVDRDGVFRRLPMIQSFDGQLYPALGLQTARAALGWPDIDPVVAEAAEHGYRAIEGLRLGDQNIPLDREGGVAVPFLGPQGSFPYISASDVFDGTADPERLRNRIVLFGTSEPGLFDLRTTPVQRVHAGVEIQANVVSAILDGRLRHEPHYLLAVEFLGLVLVAITLSLLLPRLSPLQLTVAAIGILGALIGSNMAVWSHARIILPLATPTLLTVVLFIFHGSWGYFVESRGKRQMSRLFGQYIPPELVEEISRSPEQISLQGESRELSILFSDIRGFTTISEGLEPRELARLLNAFLTPMTRVIHEHRGTIDKYMGDAIMAFWGAPLSDPDHPTHAVATALAMLETLDELQPRFEASGWPKLDIGIGLNTGIVSVGNMGSEFRMAYTVAGDAVNLASRLEGLTKQYGVQVIAGEDTRAVATEFEYRELDLVRVKGKDRPVHIYEPLGLQQTITEDTARVLQAYHRALGDFREQRWDEAERTFFALSQRDPESKLYQLYLDRIAVFRRQPPARDWDGIFTYEEK